jgi:hypothetical protein
MPTTGIFDIPSDLLLLLSGDLALMIYAFQ